MLVYIKLLLEQRRSLCEISEIRCKSMNKSVVFVTGLGPVCRRWGGLCPHVASGADSKRASARGAGAGYKTEERGSGQGTEGRQHRGDHSRASSTSTMSLYRNFAWFLKGLTEFTRNPFLAAAKHFVEKDLEVSVAGRVFMITGANSGIGKATAMAIAKKGGTLHMVCRNKDKAEEARAEIVKESGNKDVYVHILDLSETKKVWEFAEGFKRKYKTLNVLINNAGAIMSQRDVNAEGLEKSFATNVLGVYILTKSLIPLIEKSADPRVITVSSGGMLVQKLRIGNLQSDRGRFDGTMVYAQHKRQQVVLTEQLAKAHTNIHFSVMHPGWVDTPAVAKAMPDFHRSMKDSLRTPEQGADTVVWLAVAEAAKKNPSGRFYQDRKMVPTHLPLAWTHSSPLEEQKLMALLEDMAKTFQPQ